MGCRKMVAAGHRFPLELGFPVCSVVDSFLAAPEQPGAEKDEKERDRNHRCGDHELPPPSRGGLSRFLRARPLVDGADRKGRVAILAANSPLPRRQRHRFPGAIAARHLAGHFGILRGRLLGARLLLARLRRWPVPVGVSALAPAIPVQPRRRLACSSGSGNRRGGARVGSSSSGVKPMISVGGSTASAGLGAGSRLFSFRLRNNGKLGGSLPPDGLRAKWSRSVGSSRPSASS